MITDFGLSKLVNDATNLTTACGTPGYVGKFYFLFFILLLLEKKS